jgi:hypothetical protein
MLQDNEVAANALKDLLILSDSVLITDIACSWTVNTTPPGRDIPRGARESPLSVLQPGRRVLNQPFKWDIGLHGSRFDRGQNGLLQDSPGWQIMVG